jgi:hypothetical protein
LDLCRDIKEHDLLLVRVFPTIAMSAINHKTLFEMMLSELAESFLDRGSI